MEFQSFIDTAWSLHDKHTSEMVKHYEGGLKLAKNETELLALSRLITHVAVEHDFKFDSALHYLVKIAENSHLVSETGRQAVKRQIATLNYIADQNENISDFSASDRTIIFITTATALVCQNQIEKSEHFLQRAVAASLSLSDDDEAFKFLAAACNNMAAKLGDKNAVDDIERKLMLVLAHYSRNFWEKAGTWLHVERAEYGLSKYYRKIYDFENSKKHGQLCLKICSQFHAEPMEMFFAHESMALTYKELNEQGAFETHLQEMKLYFLRCGEADRLWMQASLNKAEQ